MFNSFNFDDYDNIPLSDFNEIIIKFNLKPDFSLTKEDDTIIVNEIWSNKDSDVSANRIYDFDIQFLDIIPKEIKKSLLESVLKIYVEDENYEEAISIRDILTLL